jgi:hypothetical protein
VIFPRVFTLPEANALVPLLEEHLGRIEALYGEARALHDTVEATPRAAEAGEIPTVADASQAHDGIQRAEAQIRDEVRELFRYGANITSLNPPTVDLAAFLRGKPVRLSYALGDGEVAYWHTADAADARWPVDDDTAFGAEQPQ